MPKGTANLPGSNLKTFGYFVADDAFRLSNRIMKPYLGKNLSDKKKFVTTDFLEHVELLKAPLEFLPINGEYFTQPCVYYLKPLMLLLQLLSVCIIMC